MSGRLRFTLAAVAVLLTVATATPSLAVAQTDPVSIGIGIFKAYIQAQQKQQAAHNRENQTEEFRRQIFNELAAINTKLSELSRRLIEMSVFLDQDIRRVPLRLYQDREAAILTDVRDNWDEITVSNHNRERAIRDLTRIMAGITAASYQTTPQVPYAVVPDIAYLEAATYAIIYLHSSHPYPYDADKRRVFLDYRRFFDLALGASEGSIKAMQARLSKLRQQAASLVSQMPTSAQEVVAWCPAGNGWDYRAGEVITKGKGGFYTIKLISTVNGYVVLTVRNDAPLTEHTYDAYVQNLRSLPNPHTLWEQNSPANHWPEERARDSITQQAHDLNLLIQLEHRTSQDLDKLNGISLTVS
ncbi:MAG TPA: hypothetical protein VND95_17265 [Stellaceae bacterium]|nr:hypothetical protein [Stellaceae bacterium]